MASWSRSVACRILNAPLMMRLLPGRRSHPIGAALQGYFVGPLDLFRLSRLNVKPISGSAGEVRPLASRQRSCLLGQSAGKGRRAGRKGVRWGVLTHSLAIRYALD